MSDLRSLLDWWADVGTVQSAVTYTADTVTNSTCYDPNKSVRGLEITHVNFMHSTKKKLYNLPSSRYVHKELQLVSKGYGNTIHNQNQRSPRALDSLGVLLVLAPHLQTKIQTLLTNNKLF